MAKATGWQSSSIHSACLKIGQKKLAGFFANYVAPYTFKKAIPEPLSYNKLMSMQQEAQLQGKHLNRVDTRVFTLPSTPMVIPKLSPTGKSQWAIVGKDKKKLTKHTLAALREAAAALETHVHAFKKHRQTK